MTREHAFLNLSGSVKPGLDAGAKFTFPALFYSGMRKHETGTKPATGDLIQHYVMAAGSDKRGVPLELGELRVEVKGFGKN